MLFIVAVRYYWSMIYRICRPDKPSRESFNCWHGSSWALGFRLTSVKTFFENGSSNCKFYLSCVYAATCIRYRTPALLTRVRERACKWLPNSICACLGSKCCCVSFVSLSVKNLVYTRTHFFHIRPVNAYMPSKNPNKFSNRFAPLYILKRVKNSDGFDCYLLVN